MIHVEEEMEQIKYEPRIKSSYLWKRRYLQILCSKDANRQRPTVPPSTLLRLVTDADGDADSASFVDDIYQPKLSISQ